jgi:2-keto-4-pentenoate hydratase/2-oxohepta-3-ene-1,7-dioic acid hydratase in catechol pathway
MKVFTIASRAGNLLAAGNMGDGGLVPLHGVDSILDLLTDPSRDEPPWVTLSKLQQTSGDSLQVPQTLQPPISKPSKILCVGRNYVDHAVETGHSPPVEPLVFSKLSTCVIGHGQSIVLPTASQQIDFEAELVVVVGRKARHVSRANALEYVAGYTCGNDVTARDWQKGKPGQQWLLGKSFDTFAPLGPCFVTADEIPDPQSLSIELRLNGQVMQHANTSDMIFPVDFLIAYISNVCTLLPGDLIFTGTPSGVGVARRPQVFLHPGDEIEVEVEGIGCLRNRCVAATEAG